jgi:hypothetical protein
MMDMRTKFRQWRTCVSLLKAETHQHRVVYFEMVIFQIINISQRKSETIFILRNKYRLNVHGDHDIHLKIFCECWIYMYFIFLSYGTCLKFNAHVHVFAQFGYHASIV